MTPSSTHCHSVGARIAGVRLLGRRCDREPVCFSIIIAEYSFLDEQYCIGVVWTKSSETLQ
jgi:hypothetical protein